eukprot:100385-Chlamydomonas_euryale.AAC.2
MPDCNQHPLYDTLGGHSYPSARPTSTGRLVAERCPIPRHLASGTTTAQGSFVCARTAVLRLVVARAPAAHNLPQHMQRWQPKFLSVHQKRACLQHRAVGERGGGVAAQSATKRMGMRAQMQPRCARRRLT